MRVLLSTLRRRHVPWLGKPKLTYSQAVRTLRAMDPEQRVVVWRKWRAGQTSTYRIRTTEREGGAPVLLIEPQDHLPNFTRNGPVGHEMLRMPANEALAHLEC